MHVHPVNGNYVVHPWGMPCHISPQVVDIGNLEEQPRQTLVPVTSEEPAKNELEYRGPHIHVQIPSQVAQPIAQYPYQGLQSGMSLVHPGAPSLLYLCFLILGHPMLLWGPT